MSIGTGFAAVTVDVARTVDALRARTKTWRKADETIALVPTMGALHAGHVELIRQGRARADRVVVSIFVNPKQFGPREDFSVYPRRELEDLKVLTEEGVDLAWIPTVEAVYPPGFDTTIRVGSLAGSMEGASRPGFFDGVATVVGKLFTQVAPDYAMFGEKDYQQLLVVTRMAADLDLPLEIVPVETVREPDGLALSSRNVYLSETHRALAPELRATMLKMARRLADGISQPAAEIAWGTDRLLSLGFEQVDYLDVRDPWTLAPIESTGKPARILAAVKLGETRLIDNLPVA
jgi:pantoate--beta-alanine ligase